MKVLFIGAYPPAKDGVGRYTESLVIGMRTIGVEARIVVPLPQEMHPDVLGAFSQRQKQLNALCHIVESWAPDVIHIQFAISGFGVRIRTLHKFLQIMRARVGVPVVATFHEVTREISLLGMFGRLIYGALAARCDHIIVHTRAASLELTASVGVSSDKVSVIPHPEATPPGTITTAKELRERFNLNEDELLVAFGFIFVDKGLDDLMRALRLIKSEDPDLLQNVRIVVAGRIRPRQGLFRIFELRDQFHFRHVLWLAQRGSIRDNLVLTGYVPEADVAGWFQAASGIVLPYKRTEQSGVAALANSFEVPVLATNVGGLGEQYVGSPWLFPPRNPKMMAATITDFLNTLPAERSIEIEGRFTAGIESVVRMTVNLYENVAYASRKSSRKRIEI
jgi:glycosyltransferase involved in cell wall biosynthesis